MSDGLQREPPATMPDRKRALERVLVEARARRAEFAKQRQLSPDIVGLLKQFP
ncbi:hypothetical protein [Enhydrobacter sp.]|jgi:hypothetical protein|uniref:hypothetical protein n=1 Tax=Enhydrobacter sp. TaxID=1894999 RepID=UPI0026288B6B|nr:hypothetical protein [Enhydrobacter sp.]WIM10228.1 MAG: hypothetical protein OJF58_001183 [Enhydrobacter sp.]